MKKITYYCDRCGREIITERYHITITQETDGEPEVIGESYRQDYCYDCMIRTWAHMAPPPKMPKGIIDAQNKPEEIAPENEEIAPEETITEHVPPDPEDMEEPEESVLCELKAMEEKPNGRLTPEQKSQILDMYRHGKKYKQIAELVGTDINNVRSAIHYARTKGII